MGEILKTTWDECPTDFAILEQITIARNRSEHPEHISLILGRHSESDREKHPNLFFVSERERRMYSDEEITLSTWMAPNLEVSAGGLGIAIAEVQKLADWLEPMIQERMYSRRGS